MGTKYTITDEDVDGLGDDVQTGQFKGTRGSTQTMPIGTADEIAETSVYRAVPEDESQTLIYKGLDTEQPHDTLDVLAQETIACQPKVPEMFALEEECLKLERGYNQRWVIGIATAAVATSAIAAVYFLS